jgi:hypothetical protein
MENTLLIIIISIVFIVMALYLRFVRKIPFFNTENKNIDVIGTLSNIAVILTLVYAIYSYTCTIHPIFEKEQRLIAAEQKSQE